MGKFQHQNQSELQSPAHYRPVGQRRVRNVKNGLGFVDNRPETFAQRKMQALMPPLQLASAASGKVVQGYFIIQPAQIQAEKYATFETQDLRQTRHGSTYTQTEHRTTASGVNPGTTATTTDKNSGAVAAPVVGNLPSFKVSQHGLLAVLNVGQPKNMYGKTATVTKANAIFKRSGARLRLKSEGHGVVVPANPATPLDGQTNRLKKIHAATDTAAIGQRANIQIANAFPHHYCNDFVRLITGAAADGSRMGLLKHRGDTGTEKEVLAEEAREPVEKIAYHQTRPISRGTKKLSRKLSGPALTGAERSTGHIDYQNLTNNERGQEAGKIGINEHVEPEVGEGLVIRSMETQEVLNRVAPRARYPHPVASGTVAALQQNANVLTYRQVIHDLNAANALAAGIRTGVNARIQDLMRTWGVHYAGIVAKDGNDHVSLENYNRDVEIAWEHERIFNNLFTDFQEFRNLVKDRVDSLERTPDSSDIRDLVNIVHNAGPTLNVAYNQAIQEAQTSFTQGILRTNATAQQAFFFQMYGPGNQSFHAAYKGTVSNPMTMRFRETLGPVVTEANTEVNILLTNINNYTPIVNANVIPGVTNHLQALLLTANTAHAAAVVNQGNATTRGEYKSVYTKAMRATENLRNGTQARLRLAYTAVTGQAVNPNSNNANALHTDITVFIGTYYWIQKGTNRYARSLVYQTLTNALNGVGV